MRLFYCCRYLLDVALGRHGRLTPRQIRGDLRYIAAGQPELP